MGEELIYDYGDREAPWRKRSAPSSASAVSLPPPLTGPHKDTQEDETMGGTVQSEEPLLEEPTESEPTNNQDKEQSRTQVVKL